jgi:hypothetical protein
VLALHESNPKVVGNYGQDVGDGWRHEVVVEKTLDPERNRAKAHAWS